MSKEELVRNAARYFAAAGAGSDGKTTVCENKRASSAPVRSVYTLTVPTVRGTGIPPFLLSAEPSVLSALTLQGDAEAVLFALAGYRKERAPAYREKTSVLFLPERELVPGEICRRVFSDTDAKNPTGVVLPDKGGAPAFAVVCGGQIVSVAVTNTPRTDRLLASIGIFTELGYRGQGYAAACAETLGAFWQDAGVLPLYRAAQDNEPSKRAAYRAGFAPAAVIVTAVADERQHRVENGKDETEKE